MVQFHKGCVRLEYDQVPAHGNDGTKEGVVLLTLCSCIAKNQRSVKPLSVLVQEMRVIKSDNEIELMKQSGYISAKAFIEVRSE